MTINLTLPEHRTAIELAAGEYERCLALLRTLDAEDWQRPTDCPDWTVREMACHLLGMIEMAASLREMARQNLVAMRAGGDPLDALTALQVREEPTGNQHGSSRSGPVDRPPPSRAAVVSRASSGGCRPSRNRSGPSERSGESAISPT